MLLLRCLAASLFSFFLSGAFGATFTLQPEQGSVAIEWGSMARPAPLPPLKHAALLLPVSLPGIEGKTLLMQLDLGHPKTVLYAPKWADLARRLGRDPQDGAVPSLAFGLGSLQVQAREVEVVKRSGAGIDWNSDRPEVIGTLGTDFIQGRVITLDFRAGVVALGTEREVARSSGFQPFRFEGRRLLLPAVFEGRPIELMYDSGSSAFAWLTSEAEFTRLAEPGAAAVSFPVRSWDSSVTAFTAPSAAAVTLGSITLPIGEVSRIEGMGLMQRLAIARLGAGGMVGNKLFLDRVLVIDMRAQAFALF